MVLSTPPPPNTSSTTSTTTTTRPLFPRPPNPHPFYSPARLPSNPNPNYPQLAPRPPHDLSQLLYPIASSGRGFLSRPVARHSPRPPSVFPYLDQGQGNPGFVIPTHLPPQMLHGSGPASAGGGGVIPGVAKGIPVSSSQRPKVGAPSASIHESNGHRDLRDTNRDDTLVIIRDRKVRVHDNASLYSLCRSWLRNGFPEETQPQYLNAVKSLPRPLPLAAEVVSSPDKKEGDKEDGDEDEGSTEHLSAKELLQRHVKRAKRVRSRLREERLERITRYKTRLALLLPPMVDQPPLKNETN